MSTPEVMLTKRSTFRMPTTLRVRAHISNPHIKLPGVSIHIFFSTLNREIDELCQNISQLSNGTQSTEIAHDLKPRQFTLPTITNLLFLTYPSSLL